MNGPSLNLQHQEPAPSPVAQWYCGTSEMPLSKFIKAAVKLDLKLLVISGTPDEADLLTAWSTIWQEFLDGMQGKKAQHKVRLMNDIDKLEYDYRVVQLCVQRLSMGPCQWAVDQLRRRVRVSGDFNTEDRAQYFQQLIVITNQAQSLKHRLSERQAELNVVYKREGAGVALTTQQFDHLIARVSLFAKFQINRQKTMVSEFIELYKEMKGQEDALKEQFENSKARR